MEQITANLQTEWRGATVSIWLEAPTTEDLVNELECTINELHRRDRQPNEASQRWAAIREAVKGDCPAVELWALWACRTGHGPDSPGLADFSTWLQSEGFSQTEIAAYEQIVQAELGGAT